MLTIYNTAFNRVRSLTHLRINQIFTLTKEMQIVNLSPP